MLPGIPAFTSGFHQKGLQRYTFFLNLQTGLPHGKKKTPGSRTRHEAKKTYLRKKNMFDRYPKHRTLIMAFLFAIPLSGLLPAQEKVPTLKLKVLVENITHTQGQILVGVYDKEEGAFDTKSAYQYQIIPARKGEVSCEFELPQGSYAVGAYHDENMSGDLDKNALGIPKEDYGISNGITLPNFEKAKIRLEADMEIKISLH